MSVKIDLYTDIVCPWCLIGTKRLDNVLEERFGDVDVEIEHHPVFLMPDAPQDGVDVAALLTEKFGKFDPVAFFGRAERQDRELGMDLNLSNQPRMYPTAPGHTLIRLAKRFGTQHQLSMAIASAYFLDLRNIGDLDVLADIASGYGFTKDEALALASSPEELAITVAEARAASARGVRSVPSLFVNGVAADCQNDASIGAAIKAAAAPVH